MSTYPRAGALFLAAAFALPAFAALLPAAGALPQSVNVVFIGNNISSNGGGLYHTDPLFAGFTFADLLPGAITAASLTGYDTVVLNVASSAMGCTTNPLSAGARVALVDFVRNGGKMIIYDSECTFGGAVDYSWLPFPFTTKNPGAGGIFGGTLTDLEENTLSCTDPAQSCFVNLAALAAQTDGIGDSNVVVTNDIHWCADLKASNGQGVAGYNHIYAHDGQGLYVYNGMDVDYLSAPSGTDGGSQLAKIWLLELRQAWSPSGLPCSHRVACDGQTSIFEILSLDRPALGFDYIGDAPVAQSPVQPVPRILGGVTIVASATLPANLSALNISIDGSQRASIPAPPYTYFWNPNLEPVVAGTHTIRIQGAPANIETCPPADVTRTVLVPEFSQEARAIALFAGNALPESADVEAHGARVTLAAQHDNRTILDQERAPPQVRERFANDSADTSRTLDTQLANAESVVQRVDLPDLGLVVEQLHASATVTLRRSDLAATRDASASFAAVFVNGAPVTIPSSGDLDLGTAHVRFGEVLRDSSSGHEEITVNALHVYSDQGLARDEIILGQAHAGVDLLRGSFSGAPREMTPQNDAGIGGDAANDFAHATHAPMQTVDGNGDGHAIFAGRLGGNDTADYYAVVAAPGQTLTATLLPAEATHVSLRRAHVDPLDREFSLGQDLTAMSMEMLEPGTARMRVSAPISGLGLPEREELNVDVAGAWVFVVFHNGGAVANYTLDITVQPLTLLADDQVHGPDAGSTCATAATPDAEVIAGVLRETDASDFWVAHGVIGDTFSAALKPGEDADGANFDLFVYNAACQLLGASTLGQGLIPKGTPDAVALVGLTYSGTYFVEVRRINGIGNYELNIHSTTSIPATPAADGVSGADAPDTCSGGSPLPSSTGAYNGFLADGDTGDAYDFTTLLAGQRLRVTLNVEPGVTAQVQLFGPGCALIGTAYAGLLPATLTTAPQLSAGSYTVLVTPLTSGGGYVLGLASVG